MAKEIEGYLKLQIRGGVANPSPPVGPALGSKGLNIMEFCKQFNARTQEKQGQLLPVVVTIYKDKSFDFVIKTPPAAVLSLEHSKLKKGSAEPNRAKVGSVTWDQVRAIADEEPLFDGEILKHFQLSCQRSRVDYDAVADHTDLLGM